MNSTSEYFCYFGCRGCEVLQTWTTTSPENTRLASFDNVFLHTSSLTTTTHLHYLSPLIQVGKMLARSSARSAQVRRTTLAHSYVSMVGKVLLMNILLSAPTPHCSSRNSQLRNRSVRYLQAYKIRRQVHSHPHSRRRHWRWSRRIGEDHLQGG